MKIFIAYTLVVIGIPYWAGLLFGQILTFPLAVIVGLFRRPTDEATQAQAFIQATAWSLHGSTKMPVADRILHVCMDVFNGFGAVLTAGFFFICLDYLQASLFFLFLPHGRFSLPWLTDKHFELCSALLGELSSGGLLFYGYSLFSILCGCRLSHWSQRRLAVSVMLSRLTSSVRRG